MHMAAFTPGSEGPNHYDVNQIRYNKLLQRKAPSLRCLVGKGKKSTLSEEEEFSDNGEIDSDDEYEDFEIINDSSLETVVSRPLQKRGLTSPRPVFGLSPRFSDDT